MGRVYAVASRVLVHIEGKDCGQAAKVKSLVSEMSPKILQVGSELQAAGCGAASYPWMDKAEKDKTMRDERWPAVGHLLSREWFCRGWVVQEAALARTAVVHWGNEEFELDAMWRCVIGPIGAAPNSGEIGIYWIQESPSIQICIFYDTSQKQTVTRRKRSRVCSCLYSSKGPAVSM